MLARLRTSVSNLNPSGRSRATNTPLDDKEDVVMGETQRQRKMRPRQRNMPTSEDFGGPLPMEDDEIEPITPVAAPPAPAPVAPVPTAGAATSGGDLAKELAKVKAEKAALETNQKKLEASLKKSGEDLNEAQENLAVYEEMISSFTKKEENDLQEFVDLVSEWKGKAKVFDQGQKAIEDNKTLQKQIAQMKTDLDAQKQKLVEAEAATRKIGDGKPTGAPTPALESAVREWKTKYEQAVKDLDAVKSKVAGLEKDVKSKESEIAELKGRLQVALATNTGGASGSMDDDPLIEMVEKLMKEMEAMAKENEEYMARLEEEIFSADKADESSSESKDTDSITPIPAPAQMQPAKQPASAQAPSPKMAPAAQQSSAQVKAPQGPMKPGMQPQQKK